MNHGRLSFKYLLLASSGTKGFLLCRGHLSYNSLHASNQCYHRLVGGSTESLTTMVENRTFSHMVIAGGQPWLTGGTTGNYNRFFPRGPHTPNRQSRHSHRGGCPTYWGPKHKEFEYAAGQRSCNQCQPSDRGLKETRAPIEITESYGLPVICLLYTSPSPRD